MSKVEHTAPPCLCWYCSKQRKETWSEDVDKRASTPSPLNLDRYMYEDNED